VSIILKAMSETKVKVNATKSAKAQALGIVKDLQKVLPIKRAPMRIRISFKEDE